MFGILLPVFLTWLSTVITASIHAVMRPIHLEHYHVYQAKNSKAAQQKKTSAYPQSDGYEDQQDGDEITFTQVDVSSSSDQTDLRNRNGKAHAT